MSFLLDATENASSRWLYKKDDGVRAVSGLSSALSIVGSVLIILSYLCFRSLRTRPRLILVHLALTDMGVGLANLVGVIVDFDWYYLHEDSPDETFHPNMSIAILCSAQASVAHYCTLSSVFWTSCLAVYMYLLIVNQSQRQMKLLMWFFYVFCYGMPLLVTVWLLCTKRLGYSPYNSSGWCSIIMVKPWHNKKLQLDIDLMSDVAGYNLWIVLTITLIVPLYLSVYFFVRQQYHQVKENTDSKLFWEAMHNIDYKFILIPVMFIFLRVWSLIISILLDYCRVKVPATALKALMYMAGFGDSSQGFFNAILFVAFTHNVRKHIFACSCLKSLKRQMNFEKSRTETQRLSSKPITFNSRKYSLVANEEVINSTSEENTISITPVSDYSSMSWK